MSKLRGTKRVRFNAQLDHVDDQRIRRQARLRSMSLADTLRLGIDLLEEDHAKKRLAIQQAVESHENGDGV